MKTKQTTVNETATQTFDFTPATKCFTALGQADDDVATFLTESLRVTTAIWNAAPQASRTVKAFRDEMTAFAASLGRSESWCKKIYSRLEFLRMRGERSDKGSERNSKTKAEQVIAYLEKQKLTITEWKKILKAVESHLA